MYPSAICWKPYTPANCFTTAHPVSKRWADMGPHNGGLTRFRNHLVGTHCQSIIALHPPLDPDRLTANPNQTTATMHVSSPYTMKHALLSVYTVFVLHYLLLSSIGIFKDVRNKRNAIIWSMSKYIIRRTLSYSVLRHEWKYITRSNKRLLAPLRIFHLHFI